MEYSLRTIHGSSLCFSLLLLTACGDASDPTGAGGDGATPTSAATDLGTATTGIPSSTAGATVTSAAAASTGGPSIDGSATVITSAGGGFSTSAVASGGTSATGGGDTDGGANTSGDSNTSGGGPLDCSGIQGAGHEVCASGDTWCDAVFTDGSGCTQVCAAAGLVCGSAAENIEGACAKNNSLAELPCDSGHQSDHCHCVVPGDTSAATGTGGSGSTVTAVTSAGGTTETATTTAATTSGTTGATATTGGTTGGGPLCEAMGWATRNGRTGGAVAVTGGGNASPIIVSSFGELQNYAEDSEPRVIYVDGTVGSGWSGTSGDRLEVGSNKTIVGLRPGTQLRAPIHVNGSTNVIIRNLVIQGPGSSSDQAWDNLNIEGGSKNVWIDHCEFWDGQDGNADVVKGADNVTFTWNIFGYRTGGGHNFSNLVASSDNEPQSEGKLNITLMFNWFTGVAQRQPRCRYGDIHVVNNLFTRDGQESDYGISAGKDCRVLTENNHFIGINTPIYTSHASGSAANELRGNNIFENTSGNTEGYGTAFTPPYAYEHLMVDASQVRALVEQNVGATLDSPTDCE